MEAEGAGLGDRRGSAVGGRGEARVTPECLPWAAARVVMPLPELETAAVGGGLWWGREW